MRTRTLHCVRRSGRIALVALVSLGLMPCLLSAKDFPLTSATIVPGAAGKVKTGKDKNGNTKVDVEVKHLADPEKLAPPKSLYLVWFQQKGGAPEVQGKLMVSKNLEGKLTTSTPMKSFDVFITAEGDATVKAPAGPEVLRRDNVSQ